MPTVSLAINRVWITDPDDPGGDVLICGSTQPSTISVALEGDLRHYAGGRSRASVRDQDDKTVPLTLVHLSPADLVLLVAWRGRTVLLRTMDGEREFVVYSEVPYRRFIGTTPSDDPDGIVTYDVEMTFFRVSYNESA